MVLRVARAHGQAPHVVALWPYAAALAACLALVRADREAALAREDGRFQAARLGALATWDGAAYNAERQAFDARAREQARDGAGDAAAAPDPDAGLAVLADALGAGVVRLAGAEA